MIRVRGVARARPVRVGLADLPAGATWVSPIATACLCGIGFTMARFIASLAFGTGALLDRGSFAFLLASAGSALLGLGLLVGTVRRERQAAYGATPRRRRKAPVPTSFVGR